MIHLREEYVRNDKSLKCSEIFQISGIECGLWPHLYSFRTWCDTSFTGHEHHQSAKSSFVVKLLSEIVDYSLSFELLHFHYDRWVYKTATGAIQTARMDDCSPYRSLDCKSFPWDSGNGSILSYWTQYANLGNLASS